nr:hypothetical protein [Tanacetum cinerariifolium]
VVIMSKNVKTIYDVIEDESHFITKVVDNDLGALTVFAKHFMGGVKKTSLTRSKFMVRGEECLEGCVGAGGGLVNEGGDAFGLRKSLFSAILRVVRVVERYLEIMKELFGNRLEVIVRGIEVMTDEGC